MRAPSHVTTPEQYLDCVPPAREKILRTLHAAILEAAPGLVPGICYGMIGYGIFEYKTQSGCEGDWCRVALANQKNYISLYLCVHDGDESLIEKHRHRLGKVSTGKGCIRFTRLENLNLEVAMELVKFSAQVP